MTLLMENLPLILGIILAIAVVMYVLLDGFDLGIGILFLFAKDDKDRTGMMNIIAPVWDANATWLVLGGGGLMAAFPAAYAVLMPALYVPVMTMLFALVFRGVSFEFRAKSKNSRYNWDIAFSLGSLLAAFSQGVILGAFITGVKVGGDSYATYIFAGTPWDWLSPFSLMCGFAVVIGYAFLGACWMVKKTDGAIQRWSVQNAKLLLFGVAFFIGVVSLWSPYAEPEIAKRWFDGRNFAMLFPIPLITAYFFLRCWFSLNAVIKGTAKDYTPYLYGIGIFIMSYFGLGISYWPYLVPHKISVWDAAAAPDSQLLILIGVLIVLPVILFYTAFAYKIFWGKTSEHGYH